MKRILVVSLVLASLTLASVFGISALAYEPVDENALAYQEACEARHEACEAGDWKAMHEVCENSDWEARHEACEEIHGGGFDDMPCHDEGYYNGGRVLSNGWGGMSGHMGRGMMSW